jgi:S-formylglutathione hydrolase FrmB
LRGGDSVREHRRQMRRAALIAVGVLLALPGAANAAGECTRHPPAPSPYPERLHRHVLDGHAFTVLVPAGYEADPTARFPVLLLLHPAAGNEHTWVGETDLVAWTGGLAAADGAIVVTPAGGAMGSYSDWKDGSQAWQTLHLERILPWVEANYRVRTEPRQRAVAGFSLGGYGAMHYALHRPDLFAAVASFSGSVSQRPHGVVPGEALGPGVATAQTLCGERAPTPPTSGPHGGPLDRETIEAHDPVTQAARYAGLTVQVSAGTGEPCPGDLQRAYSPVHLLAEPPARDQGRELSEALTRAGVPHFADLDRCGIHVPQSGRRALALFWPRMLAAFERERPSG